MAHKLSDRERTSDVKLNSGTEIHFANLLLSPKVLKGLVKAGFVTPSPIQLEAIPIGRCGFDLIVQAKSGTGKTCVFAVIALDSIDIEIDCPQVLVLAPTREIVVQIAEVVTSIASSMPKLRCHSFIGGMPIAQDRVNVRKCQIAIGTPGRIKQLILEKSLKTDAIRLFVLDEADKLLEGNFQEDINWIYYSMPGSKQILALSATYPDELAQLLTKYMLSPTFVRLNAQSPALLGVKQFFKLTAFHTSQHRLFENKVPHVVDILSSVPFGQCLVFSNYQMRAQSLCDRLNGLGWPATYICGKQDQSTRLQAISRLRDFKCRILISTDLIARGIDVENVNLIINLDVPWDVETYLHRIGRAGRFGTLGVAVTLAARGAEEELLMRLRAEGALSMQDLPDRITVDLLKLSEQPESPPATEGDCGHVTVAAEEVINESPSTDKTTILRPSEVLRNTTDGIAPSTGNSVTNAPLLSSDKIGAALIETLKHERNLQLESEGNRIKSKKTSKAAVHQTNLPSVEPSSGILHGVDSVDERSESDGRRTESSEPEANLLSASSLSAPLVVISEEFPNYYDIVADLDRFCAEHPADSCKACVSSGNDVQDINGVDTAVSLAVETERQEVTDQLRELFRGFKASCRRHVTSVDPELSDRLINRFGELLWLDETNDEDPISESEPSGTQEVDMPKAVPKYLNQDKEFVVDSVEPRAPTELGIWGACSDMSRQSSDAAHYISSTFSNRGLPPWQPVEKFELTGKVSDSSDDDESQDTETDTSDYEIDHNSASTLKTNRCFHTSIDARKHHDNRTLNGYGGGIRNGRRGGARNGYEGGSRSDCESATENGYTSGTPNGFESTAESSRIASGSPDCRNRSEMLLEDEERSDNGGSDVSSAYQHQRRVWDDYYRAIRMQKCQVWYSEYMRYMLRRH